MVAGYVHHCNIHGYECYIHWIKSGLNANLTPAPTIVIPANPTPTSTQPILRQHNPLPPCTNVPQTIISPSHILLPRFHIPPVRPLGIQELPTSNPAHNIIFPRKISNVRHIALGTYQYYRSYLHTFIRLVWYSIVCIYP